MSWIALTEADLLTVLSGPELASYRSAALEAGQADPVAPTLTQVIDLVRGYVAASPAGCLGAGETIPQKLRAPALDLLAFRIPNRVGLSAGETRQRLHDQALRLLEQVAAGRYQIEQPAEYAGEAESAPSPLMTARVRQFTRQDQDGI